jgi:hypothetical protein
MKLIYPVKAIILLLLSTPLAHAFYFQATLYQKENGPVAIAFKDIHTDDKKFLYGAKQASELTEQAAYYNAVVIAEDKENFTEYAHIYRRTLPTWQYYLVALYMHKLQSMTQRGYLRVESQKDGLEFSPLLGVTQRCLIHNIQAKNIDFRVLTNFSSSLPIKALTVIDLYNAIAQQCQKYYSDNPTLQKMYTQTIGECSKALEAQRSCIGVTNTSLRWQSIQEKQQQEINNVGSKLIDIAILHALQEHRNQKLICIVAGGYHIKNIEPVLLALGYQKKEVFGKDYGNDQLDVLNVKAVFQAASKYLDASNIQKDRGPLISQPVIPIDNTHFGTWVNRFSVLSYAGMIASIYALTQNKHKVAAAGALISMLTWYIGNYRLAPHLSRLQQ